MLVTSREALRVRGERLFAVPPLALPDDVTSADAVERSAAGRLFVERAGDARPGFELTDDDAEDVAEICGRLDGLPLAIELAAARIALFSPGELRDRLREHAGDVLSGVLIPMLDDLVQQGGARGIEEIIIGMAHRGRLNVLVNVLGKSPTELFSEFEGYYDKAKIKGTGDVKYHKGFTSDRRTKSGGNVHL